MIKENNISSVVKLTSPKFFLFLLLVSVVLGLLCTFENTEQELVCDKLKKQCMYSEYDTWGRSSYRQAFQITPNTVALIKYELARQWNKVLARHPHFVNRHYQNYKVYGVSISTDKTVFMFERKYNPIMIENIPKEMNFYFESPDRMFRYTYGSRSSFLYYFCLIFLLLYFLFFIMWIFNRPKNKVREI